MKQVYISLTIVALVVAGYFYFTNKKEVVVPDTAVQTVPATGTETSSQTSMKATIKTNLGDIVLELFPTDTPKTVQNFAALAEAGFYDGTRFHRVIKGFMIQGGDPLSRDTAQQDRWGTGGPGYQFEDEIHDNNHNMTGTIAMANSGPNTNGSQFFINAADNNFLDTKHTVFGKVISGMDVVRKIEALPTQSDRPTTEALVEKISVTRGN